MRKGVAATLSEFRRDYRSSGKAEEDRREIWTYWVVRPLSFYLAALFLRLGIDANQTTWLSILVAVAGCLLVGFGSSGAALIGAALLMGWLVLDCTDGTLARHHESFGPYGAYLDSISGYTMYALVYLAAGIGAYNRPDEVVLTRVFSEHALDPAAWLLLGAWASIAALWSRLVYQRFKNSFDQLELRRHEVIDTAPADSWTRRLQAACNHLLNVSGLLTVLLFLALLLGALDLFLLVTALGNGGILGLALRWLLRHAASFGR